jgi:prepilin-type N-terminal cleavage/methylation domain-containing protein
MKGKALYKKEGFKKGFTLIEILMAMVMMGVLGSGLLGLQSIISQNQIQVWRDYVNVDEANTSITALARELRTSRPGDNGAYPLEAALDQEIIFYSDIDFDGEAEKVRYFLAGSDFSKGIIEPVGQPATYPSDSEKVKVLSENVRNGETPIFYYYNGDWPIDQENNPLEVPARLSETKLMRIYLRLNNKEGEPEKDYILETYVQIRMLKENL